MMGESRGVCDVIIGERKGVCDVMMGQSKGVCVVIIGEREQRRKKGTNQSENRPIGVSE